MNQRMGWAMVAVGIVGIVAAGAWLWSEQPERREDLHEMMEQERSTKSASGNELVAQRSSSSGWEPADPATRKVYRSEVSAYEAGLSGTESEEVRAHDRAMAIGGLGELIDVRASVPPVRDQHEICLRLETWYATEKDADVREMVLEALAPQRSGITARVLWRAMSDADLDVRETAEFHVADILEETVDEGGEARRYLLERARAAAADPASSLRKIARELLEDIDGEKE